MFWVHVLLAQTTCLCAEWMDMYSLKPLETRNQFVSEYGQAAISRQESLGHCWVPEGGPLLALVVYWHLTPGF